MLWRRFMLREISRDVFALGFGEIGVFVQSYATIMSNWRTQPPSYSLGYYRYLVLAVYQADGYFLTEELRNRHHRTKSTAEGFTLFRATSSIQEEEKDGTKVSIT